MSDVAGADLQALEETAFQWIFTASSDFSDLAQDEVLAADNEAQMEELGPGIILVTSSISFADLAAKWSLTPPVFVRHVCPVHAIVMLPTPDDPAEPELEQIISVVTEDIQPALHDAWTFSVQTRTLEGVQVKPFTVNDGVASVLRDAGLSLDVRVPAQVISILLAAQGDDHLTAWIGGSLADHNLSDWAGGMRRFAREDDQISRAEFKLLEAVDVFLLDLPARGVALDLGAAPGGWARVLRNMDQYVTAVDPAELDPRVASNSSVRHKQMSAEDYLLEGFDPFDVIVNDMRMDARDSARLMLRFAGALYAHGWALMTLKLPTEGRRKVLDEAFAILREEYVIAGARQLFHNRSEITVYLRPRHLGPPN